MGVHLFEIFLVACSLHCVVSQLSCTDQELPASPVDIDIFGGPWDSGKSRVKTGHTHVGQDGWGCVCVPRSACRTGKSVEPGEEECDYHGGADIIEVRTYRPAIPAHQCPNTQHVCCPHEHLAGNRTSGCAEPGCGLRHPDGVGYCTAGDFHGDSAFGEFPWMAAIAVERQGGVRFQCGASLINRKVVLTAAHCVFGLDPKALVVRVGEWDARSNAEPLPHQDLLVASIEVHPKYTTDTLYNDIALLFLDTPVRHAEHVAPICLPEEGTDFDKSRCFVTGWGQDLEDRQGTFHAVLKKRDVPIVSRSKCQTLLRKSILGESFKLHDSFLCAGGERGWDACVGDGGGPLVCPIIGEPSKWQQAGIVAWGIGCGKDRTPAVYVDVAHFRSWIDRKLAERKISSTSYKP